MFFVTFLFHHFLMIFSLSLSPFSHYLLHFMCLGDSLSSSGIFSAQLNTIYLQWLPHLKLNLLGLLTGELNCSAGILVMIVHSGRKQDMDASSSSCQRAEGSRHLSFFRRRGRLKGCHLGVHGARKPVVVLTDSLMLHSE